MIISDALGIIPARKGSKGLPGKNTKLLGSKPLIAHTIEAALDAKGILPAVTTDDNNVIAIAQSYGIECQYRRPPELAGDEVGMDAVVKHFINWYRQRGQNFSIFVLLEPTSPFRSAIDIERALTLLEQSKAPSVVGVSPMWTHPWECVETFDDGSWRYLAEPAREVKRRQDFVGNFQFINGAIYAVRVDAFEHDSKFVFPNSRLLSMSEENTIDIDTERDFYIAQTFLDNGMHTATI